MSAADTNEPSAAKKAMLRGCGVSRIQNDPVVASSQAKSIPSAPDRSVTPISPRARATGSAASHRHTSHVDPSGAVTRPLTSPKSWGVTPVVGGVVGAAVVGAAVAGTAVTGTVVVVVMGVAVVTVVGATLVGDGATTAVVGGSAPSDEAQAADRAASDHQRGPPRQHPGHGTRSLRPVPVGSTCESCGAPGEELYAVHRQYVTPADWDTPAREVTLAEVEHWCFSCCTHYPHVLVEG